ncbi:MAG: lipopolysaccharide heptosyltransferase II [Kiritimatiellae bacterium]|nr:lipopolysaccharide heptosyltransferase II [Kiritimatiellia bacterium]
MTYQDANAPILIYGVNWVGDSIMSMPALQAFRKKFPDTPISLLVKPRLVPLWEMHPVPDQLIELEEGFSGTFRTVRNIREKVFNKAFIFPHSFRSALLPFLAKVPERRGLPGHARDGLLTQVIKPEITHDRCHQAYEYLDLVLGQDEQSLLEPPTLHVPERTIMSVQKSLSKLPSPSIGLIPGAARGTSKQWPFEHFIRLGRKLVKNEYGVVIFGAPGEYDLCEKIVQAIGKTAINLSGKTDFHEWAAWLKLCSSVVANDSGGMHLAAAVGTPVVALYGMTDPLRTGPLGARSCIFQKSSVRSRDIKRQSKKAGASLTAILPKEVFDAVESLLASYKTTEEIL